MLKTSITPVIHTLNTELNCCKWRCILTKIIARNVTYCGRYTKTSILTLYFYNIFIGATRECRVIAVVISALIEPHSTTKQQRAGGAAPAAPSWPHFSRGLVAVPHSQKQLAG